MNDYVILIMPTKTQILWIQLCAWWFIGLAGAQTATPTNAQPPDSKTPADLKVTFSANVAQILQDNCVACHSAKKSEGGYRLDTFHDLMQPGDSSEAPVVAKQPDASVLMQRIVSSDASLRMPPQSNPLSVGQIETIRHWISTGAEFDKDDPKQLLALVSPPQLYAPPPVTYPPVPLTAVAFSPDGTQVICGGYHELTIWDAATGRLIRRIANVPQRTYSIKLSPDGKFLAVAGGDPGRNGEVRLIDFFSGEIVGVIGRSIDVVFDVAFRPNRDELAVASADHSIRIINFKSMEQLRTYSSHADWVTSVAFSADGNRLASASRDKSAKVFDLESGQMLTNYTGHAAPVRGVCFTSDGTQIASVGDDKKLHRWNVSDGKKVGEISIEGEAYQLTRRDDFVIVPSASQRVLKIELANNKIAQVFSGHSDWVLSTAISADGRIMAGSLDGAARIWSADGGLVASWSVIPTPTSP